MDQIASLLAYLPIAVGLAWFAGSIVAVEDWWGDTRRRFENWAYRDGDKVRGNHPDADDFWHRARPWYPFGGEIGSPLRLKPARRRNRLATCARTKAADMVGCPVCSGWWASLPVGVIGCAALGPWTLSWAFLAVHAAGWGIARRIGWNH